MKTAVITGASSGIGLAVALKLKKEGYNVVGSYLNGKEIATKIEKEHGISYLKCDVSDEASVSALFDFAKKTYGRVDVVIANAGICLEQKPLIDVGANEIERIISINLKGAIITNKQAVLSMLISGGKIINVSSIFGLKGGSCEVVYSATKAGVIGLTKSLAEELDSSDIEVCCVCPGLIDTPMNDHLTYEDKLEFVKECGLNKIPTADDVSEEIYKILSSCDRLNGKIIPLFAGEIKSI